MKLDDLDNCPQCGEDMREGDRLCRNCLQQEKIDNMTDADYRAGNPSLPPLPWPIEEPSAFKTACYKLVDILWNPDEPYCVIQFKKPGSREWEDTPFKTIEFAGWEGTLVAKHVNDWFITQASKK